MKKLSSYKNNPLLLPLGSLIIIFLVNVCTLWPGVMSPDATWQYTAARNGFYSDHHPPLMSFVWRYLDMLYPGPASMFVLHLSLLYIASGIFIWLFKNSRFKWWYVVYPVLPSILAYTALIVKDTGFTFSYLLSGAILTALCMHRVKRYRSLLLSIICLLLFYGTAVKFQAKFILIFFTFAVSYCACNYQITLKTLMMSITLFTLIFGGVLQVNSILVPKTQEAHSWQYVKAYDLSAISIELNTPLYPDCIKNQLNFDFGKIKQAFLVREIDPLVFTKPALIEKVKDDVERAQVWDYWFKTITEHPILYLKSRLKLFSYNLTTAPCDRNNPVKFLSTTALAPLLNIPGVDTTINAGYTIFKIILRFMWLLPFMFINIYLGFKSYKHTKTAMPLLYFNLSAATLLLVLLFCSMAATARYVFLCTCFIHISHGLTYRTWQVAKQKLALTNVVTENKKDLGITA